MVSLAGRWGSRRGENLAVFLVSWLIYLGLSLRLLALDVHFGDAVARTAAAFSVFFSRDPHLANLGFAWNPLPAVLQLPLVAVLRLLGGDVLLAGPLQSSLAGALLLVVLNAWVRLYPIPRALRWAMVGLLGVNPMIALYAANGMSEAVFFLLTSLAVIGFLRWAEIGSVRGFILLTGATMLVLQTRFEALPLTAAFALCFAPVMFPLARFLGLEVRADRIEAHLVTYLAAAAYSFGLWVFFNWIIVGDPLYFLRGAYSNAAQTALVAGPAVGCYTRGEPAWLNALLFTGDRLVALSPALPIVALATAIYATLRRNIVVLCTLVIFGSVPIFHFMLLLQGSSYGWLRFFAIGIVATFILVVQTARLAPWLVKGKIGAFGWPLLLGMLLVSDIASWVAMNRPDMSCEEWVVVGRVMDETRSAPLYSLAVERGIDRLLSEIAPDGKVLADSVLGFAMPLVASDPRRYVINSDRDFERILASPVGAVRFVLVAKPEGLGQIDRINQEYPELWESGGDWVRLVADFGESRGLWRLYEVQSDASPESGA